MHSSQTPTAPHICLLLAVASIRRRKDLPVIMLTARAQREDRIAGLNTGADDYLPKPFEFPELVSRVETARHPRRSVA